MYIPFDNSFAKLPDSFYSPQDPTPVSAPKIIRINQELAGALGLDPDGLSADMLGGNAVPVGATPIATAYAGHQFGGFVPQLGDGRAVLLGEVISPDGQRFDMQLKGSGRTAFSRGGDGRATLGAVLREYVVSEAMHALNIPTTRALAAVTTGDIVPREEAFPGAVLTRIAASHIRVGTFQYHHAQRDTAALQTLTDYVIQRHYPAAQSPVDLLRLIMQRQADLIAKWMGAGFIHGVMNTDNMSIAGETIDFGPCAFLDEYHPDKVFSSIDRRGRYAFSNQPVLAHWNLAQLASTLVPLVGEAEILQKVLDGFEALFEAAFLKVFQAKLGQECDRGLIDDLLKLMADNQVDFTVFFRRLTDQRPVETLFQDKAGITAWLARWGGGDIAQMQTINPVYIPRNHQLEHIIQAANTGDYAPFETLMTVLAKPFERRAGFETFEAPPTPDETIHATFCGT